MDSVLVYLLGVEWYGTQMWIRLIAPLMGSQLVVSCSLLVVMLPTHVSINNSPFVLSMGKVECKGVVVMACEVA